jgi:hypothetical protein
MKLRFFAIAARFCRFAHAVSGKLAEYFTAKAGEANLAEINARVVGRL